MKSEFWKGKKVLITGHTGFKGSWLSYWLHTLGSEVSGLALDPITDPNLFDLLKLNKKINSHIGDIRDPELVSKVVDENEPEIIFHLAAQPLVRESYKNPLYTYEVNVNGTLHLMEAVRENKGVKAFVVITSDKCYQNLESGRGFKEEDPMGGGDPYSNSKGCAELVVDSYRTSFFREMGIPLATARAGNVIGGGDWSQDRLVPDLIKSIHNSGVIKVRNPNAVRPWQHVLEPLHGYLLLAEGLENGKDFASGWNFGPHLDDSKTVQFVVETLVEQLGRGKWEIDGGDHPHEANLLHLDCSKAQEKLDWIPKLSVTEGFEWVSQWYGAWMIGSDMEKITSQQIEEFQRL